MRCFRFHEYESINILWGTDPFLGNDDETNKKTKSVARQHFLNEQQMSYSNRETVESGVFYYSRL
jgi:hypothetical protein